MSTFHNEQTSADGIHVIVRWEFATLADRNTAVGVPGGAYAATDDGGVARVGAAAPYNFYILRDGSTTPTPNTAWTNVGLGAGDVVGPGAGTSADEVCVYADAGGLTLKGSGKAKANIPSTLPLPIGEGGTGAATVAEAAAALSTPLTGLMVVNAGYPVGAPEEGTEACPFRTIQGALSAIGPAATSIEELQSWEVRIAPGFYDEDLQLPDLRTIWLNGTGGVRLTDTVFGTQRQISFVQSGAPLTPTSKIKITQFSVLGPITFSSSSTAQYELELEDVEWIMNPPQPCLDMTGWQLGAQLRITATRCRFHSTSGTVLTSNTGAPGADVFIKWFDQCEVEGSIQCGGYGRFMNCHFDGGLNFLAGGGATSGSNLAQPLGFFDCDFGFGIAKTIACQQSGDFLVDSATWMSWVGDPANSFAGSGTFIGDPVRAIADGFYNVGDASVWAPGGDPTVKAAIKRLAAALASFHGPIA